MRYKVKNWRENKHIAVIEVEDGVSIDTVMNALREGKLAITLERAKVEEVVAETVSESAHTAQEGQSKGKKHKGF